MERGERERKREREREREREKAGREEKERRKRDVSFSARLNSRTDLIDSALFKIVCVQIVYMLL